MGTNQQIALKRRGETRKALTETIRIFKDRNVFREYLLDREKQNHIDSPC